MLGSKSNHVSKRGPDGKIYIFGRCFVFLFCSILFLCFNFNRMLATSIPMLKKIAGSNLLLFCGLQFSLWYIYIFSVKVTFNMHKCLIFVWNSQNKVWWSKFGICLPIHSRLKVINDNRKEWPLFSRRRITIVRLDIVDAQLIITRYGAQRGTCKCITWIYWDIFCKAAHHSPLRYPLWIFSIKLTVL